MRDLPSEVVAAAVDGPWAPPHVVADRVLRDLTAAGYAVVKVTGGVKVGHGARLVPWAPLGEPLPVYLVEPAPEEAPDGE